jgi:hypothetical protein
VYSGGLCRPFPIVLPHRTMVDCRKIRGDQSSSFTRLTGGRSCQDLLGGLHGKWWITVLLARWITGPSRETIFILFIERGGPVRLVLW